MDLINSPVPYEAFPEEHPELFHYTNARGLSGIVGSNTLWAAHYEQLNDTSEITHLRAPLLRAIAPHCLEITRRRFPKLSEEAVEFNGTTLARKLIDRLYINTYRIDRHDLRPSPFITSFCAHDIDMGYEIQNGLLSQWRGYAGGEGYCLVFDTLALCDLLAVEWRTRGWFFLGLDRVRYAESSREARQLIRELVDVVERDIDQFVEHDILPNSVVQLFLIYSAMLKHEGFKEEREVRIAGIPLPDLHRPMDGRQRIGFIATDRKKYIALFGNGRRLPIRRVIVGPSRDQDKSVALARSLLGPGVEITRSATPWLPPV